MRRNGGPTCRDNEMKVRFESRPIEIDVASGIACGGRLKRTSSLKCIVYCAKQGIGAKKAETEIRIERRVLCGRKHVLQVKQRRRRSSMANQETKMAEKKQKKESERERKIEREDE